MIFFLRFVLVEQDRLIPKSHRSYNDFSRHKIGWEIFQIPLKQVESGVSCGTERVFSSIQLFAGDDLDENL